MSDFQPLKMSGIHAKWGWFVALGVALLVFGIIAFANLMVATAASVFYVGLLMLMGGVIHLIHAFQVKGWENILFWTLSGVLYLLAGIIAFQNPNLTAAVLTLMMAVALVIAGVSRIWLGLKLRPEKLGLGGRRGCRHRTGGLHHRAWLAGQQHLGAGPFPVD